MKLLDRVLARPQNAALSLEDPAYPLTSSSLLEALHIPTRTSSSIYVDEKASLGMAAVWRAVNLISSVSAALPLHAYKTVPVEGRDEPGRQLLTTGQAADLLADPHPDLTSFELWEIAYAHVALWGNAYLRKLRDQYGVVRELWPIHPSRVRAGRASDMSKVYEIDGQTGVSDNVILHIPGFGYDGVAGLSPIQCHRAGIGLALAAEDFGGKLFGGGSLAGGIITTSQRLTQTQADGLKARWKSSAAGLDNAHDIAVLGSGATFEKLTIPPDDAQFIQTRGFQIEEVSRIFGMPPHMLMAVDKSTSWGTGIEQQTLGWLTFSLQPTWLTRFEQRISKLVAPGNVYARYSLQGLLRGDSKTRAAFYQTMWNMGALSTNDIRALEEQSPVPGGDMRYRPLNYGELGTADTGTGAPDPAKTPGGDD